MHVTFNDVIECHHMNDLCTRPIFGRVQRSFFWGDVIAQLSDMYMYYVCSCPAHLPARRVGSGDGLHYVWQRTCWIFMNHSMRICMTINEHAAYALCSGEGLCILLAYRLREMHLMNHEYILALRIIAVQMKSRNPLWNPEIRLKSRNPSRNPLWKSRNPLWNPEIRLKSRNLSRNPLWNPEIRFEIQKSTLKSRNPLWNPEIRLEIQKSALKSRNPLWNPEIHFEIQKSTLKSRNPLWNPEIHSEIRNPLEIQWISKSRTPRRAVAGVFFFWTHFRLSLWMTTYLRMRVPHPLCT